MAYFPGRQCLVGVDTDTPGSEATAQIYSLHRKFYKPVLTGEGVNRWVWPTGVRHLARDGALIPDTSENLGLIPESQTFQWLLYPHGAHSQACLELVPLEQHSVPKLTHYSTCSQAPQFVIFDVPL